MQQPLVFIDTNILLDFYRQRRGDISLKYLAEIEKKYKSLILTSQVEMEYKKNRQKAILDSLKQIKDETPSYGIPPILSESQPAKMLKKKKKEYQQQEKTLKDRIANILRSPSHSDKVFQSLNRVFKKSWGYHQNRLFNR
jgi:predicted nucleic acid-binding protein